MERIGTAFRRSVSAFAEAEHVPVVRFGKADRKIDVMRRHVAAQAATGRSGVAAIGVAQESQAATSSPRPPGGAVTGWWFSFYQGRPAGHVLLFLSVGRRVRAGFIKVCAYFPLSGQGVAQRA